MNIGITIRRTSGGSNPVYKKNSFGLDVDADYIIKSAGLCDSDSAVFLNVCQDGTSIYVWQQIGGRGGDNSTFVIHVPKHCVLTHSQLKELFAKLREISKRSNIEINESKDALDSLCNENYTEQPGPKGWYSASELSSMSDQFACMLYDETYNESEFLSQLLSYQSSFAKYKFVFVAPQGTSINAHDLSKTGIEKYVFIEVPELDGALKKFYDKPSVEKGAKVGSEILIEWKGKAGYFSGPKTLTVEDNGTDTFTIPSLQEIDVKRKVSRNLLNVVDQSNQPIRDFTVTFNKQPEGSNISYDALRNVTVEVRDNKNRYKITSMENVDLTSDKAVVVKLQKKDVVYEILGRDRNFYELKGIKGNSSESPIEGYEFIKESSASRNNEITVRLKPIKKSSFNLVSFLLGILIMSIICSAALIVMDRTGHVHWGKQKTPTNAITRHNVTDGEQHGSNGTVATEGSGESSSVEVTPSMSELDKAIAYLDGKEDGLTEHDKNTWDKTKMESYEELKGLYDDLVNLDLNVIVSKWGEKLSNSSRFKDNVVNPAKKALRNNYTVKSNKYVFLKNDGIHIDSYKKWLQKDHKIIPNNSGGHSGNNGAQSGQQGDDDGESQAAQKY